MMTPKTMSLCRFSSLDWQCDLYCFYDCDGTITTHVASKRFVNIIPHCPSVVSATKEGWSKAYKAQEKAMKSSDLISIDLPEAGTTHKSQTVEEFLELLTRLRDLGYVFPESLFDVDEEPE